MFCQFCGKEVADSETVCPHCSRTIENEKKSTPTRAEKSNDGLIGLLLGLFLGIIGLIIALCVNKEEMKRNAIKGFVISLIISVVIGCIYGCSIATILNSTL